MKTLTEVLHDPYEGKRIYVEPILTSHSINLLYAPTGVGKTFLSLLLACNLTSCTPFLDWKTSDKPPRVLYVDGEMGYQGLQQRLTSIIKGIPSIDVPPSQLCFLSFEEFTDNMPNLGDPRDHKFFAEKFKGFDVVIVDNLDTTTYPLNSRDSDVAMWFRMRPWLLRMRQEGMCLIFVDHSNKSGELYGTSKKTNTIDTCIALHKPQATYKTQAENYFRLTVPKGRYLLNRDKVPRWVEMFDEADGGTTFSSRMYDSFLKERVVEMENLKLKPIEIAEMLGISKQKVLELKYTADPLPHPAAVETDIEDADTEGWV